MDPMMKSNKLSLEAKLEASIRIPRSLPPQNKIQKNDGQLADPMFSVTLPPTTALDVEPIHLAGWQDRQLVMMAQPQTTLQMLMELLEEADSTIKPR